MAAPKVDVQNAKESAGSKTNSGRLARLREKLVRPRRPASAEVTPSPKDLGKEHRGY